MWEILRGTVRGHNVEVSGQIQIDKFLETPLYVEKWGVSYQSPDI